MGKVVLHMFIVLGFVLFPIAFRRKPIKDGVIVYGLTAAVSAILDVILVRKKLLSYPVRIFPNHIKFHIVFDLLLCPLAAVFYHQVTYNDKSIITMIGKLLLFTIPQLTIEVVTGRYLNLVKWHKWWKWYHTFISMNLKFLSIRLFMQAARNRF